MIDFRPPSLAPVSLGRRMIAQQAPPANPDLPTPGQVKGLGTAMGLFMTALSAGTAWVGINTAMKERGAIKYVGGAVGVLGVLSGLSELWGTIKLVATPQADIQKWLQENGTRPPTAPLI